MIRIAGLFIYPVKSCRGISVAEAELGARGFRHDREFLVVDENDVALTQRNAPRLATVDVALRDHALILAIASGVELNVSLGKISQPRPREIKIFDDRVMADDAGDEAADWFSAVLERKCRLVRIGASYSRTVPLAEIAEQHRPDAGPEIPFTDAFPILLISEESLADLNSRLPRPLAMNRFRPTIVVRGGAAYDENRWNNMRAGDLIFRGATGCPRCVITTIDQETGMTDGPEPLRTLASYRRAPDGHGVIFGQYLIHSGSGMLRVGDVLQTEL